LFIRLQPLLTKTSRELQFARCFTRVQASSLFAAPRELKLAARRGCGCFDHQNRSVWV